MRSNSDLEAGTDNMAIPTWRLELGFNSDLEDEITSDLQDEIEILQDEIGIPRTKLRFNSDLEEITYDLGRNHFGPRTKLLRTWRTKLR